MSNRRMARAGLGWHGWAVAALFSMAAATVACSSDSDAADDVDDVAGAGAGGAGSAGAPIAEGGAGTGGAPASGGTFSSGGSLAGQAPNAAAGSSGSAGSSVATGGAGAGGGGSSGAGGASGGAAAIGGSGAAGSAGAGGAAAFTLMSPMLAPNAMFAAANTCAGANRSLEFDWTPGPAGTMSYALIMTDTTNNLTHWVLWDVPVATVMLPAMLGTTQVLTAPSGAHQVSIGGYGYSGPCPNGNLHVYRFDLHAINVKNLAGLPASPTTMQASAAILAASLGKVSLTGQSNAKRP